MAGDDGDWVVTKPGQGGAASSSSAPSSSSDSGGSMGMGGGGNWTVTPTKESKAAPAKSASTDDVPGGSDASTVFFRHLVSNLPGGEDAAAFLDSYSTGKSVRDQKAALQSQEAQDWDEHPWAAGAGAGTSYLGQAVALPVAGPEEAIAGLAAKYGAGRLAPTLGRAAVGGVYGGVTGGTEGPDLWNTSGAVTGAVTGGVGAAVIPPLVGGAAKGVGRWAGLITPETEAARKIATAAEGDELTGAGGPWAPGKGAMSQSDFAKAKAAGQSPMAADLGGEHVRELADQAALASPAARAALKDAADARYTSQQGRFGKYMDGLFPGKDLNTATQRDEINFASRQANSTAYSAAYNHPNAQAVWSGDLANLMRDPNVQAAIPKAQSKAASAAVTDKVPLPNNPFIRDADGNWGLRVDAQGNTATPSLKWWDYVNRSLGDQVSAARRAGNMDDARVIGGIQSQLQGALDQKVPQFAQARATAAGFFNESNLVDAAVKFDKTNNESALSPLLKDLAGRSDDDKEVFARAYAAQLKQRAANPGEQADMVKQFNSQTIRGKMDAALNTPSNPTRSQELRAYMLRETAFNKLRGTFGNSKTPERLAAQQRAGEGHGGLGSQIAQQFTAPVSGGLTGAAAAYHETPESADWGETAKNVALGGAGGALLGIISKQRGKVNTATWNEIARQLSSDDPNIYQNALKRVARRPEFMKQFEQALTPLVGAAGGQFGAANSQ